MIFRRQLKIKSSEIAANTASKLPWRYVSEVLPLMLKNLQGKIFTSFEPRSAHGAEEQSARYCRSAPDC
jgi:hypothetical protein